MVTVKTGDLFKSSAQTLVNTVNTVGVMGKGIALEFKKRFPEMFADYQQRCERGEVRLGRPYLFKRATSPWILNFPTKQHWRGVSRIADIEEGLRYLTANYRAWGIESLAVPPLGCGLGQLDWRVVGPTLYRGLQSIDVPVELYAPAGTPPQQLTLEFLASPTQPAQEDKPSAIPASWVALAATLDLLAREGVPPLGRIAFQKLVYFATSVGVPTGFVHERDSYGPFSSELKPAVTKLVNNGVLREDRHGRMFAVRPGPTYRDAVQAHKAQLSAWKPMLLRVVDLFARFDTQEAEVAATVSFAARELDKNNGTRKHSELEVFQAVKNWKMRRRPPLADEQIGEAVRFLNAMQWIDATYSAELPLPADVRELDAIGGPEPTAETGNEARA